MRAAVAEVVSRMEALGGDESRLRERAEFLRFIEVGGKR